jgi:ADP-heptose:LPS heptosyltransferase
MSKPTHILVIRLSAMGDVAMTVPVLRAVVTQYPDIKLTVLTRAFYKPFFKDIPNIQVYTADLKNRHKGILGLWKLSKELKAQEFDCVADLHNVLRSKVLKLFFFGKAIVQIDKGRQEKKALTSGRSFKQLKTTHQRYADVFKKLGYPVDLHNPIFPETTILEPKLRETLGDKTKPWIGLAPFAAFEGKKYPYDLLEELISELTKSFKVLLFGGPGHEASMLSTLATEYNAINMADRFPLEKELEVISNLDLMISMDSGNAHLAAMLGVHVITVWGVTHPYAGFLPFNHTMDSTVLADRKRYPKIPTSIYGNKMPEGYKNTMRSISPERIIEKVISSLK